MEMGLPPSRSHAPDCICRGQAEPTARDHRPLGEVSAAREQRARPPQPEPRPRSSTCALAPGRPQKQVRQGQHRPAGPCRGTPGLRARPRAASQHPWDRTGLRGRGGTAPLSCGPSAAMAEPRHVRAHHTDWERRPSAHCGPPTPHKAGPDGLGQREESWSSGTHFVTGSHSAQGPPSCLAGPKAPTTALVLRKRLPPGGAQEKAPSAH